MTVVADVAVGLLPVLVASMFSGHLLLVPSNFWVEKQLSFLYLLAVLLVVSSTIFENVRPHLAGGTNIYFIAELILIFLPDQIRVMMKTI